MENVTKYERYILKQGRIAVADGSGRLAREASRQAPERTFSVTPDPAPEAEPAPHAPVLVVNAGSSSLKLRLLPDDQTATVERIGVDPAASSEQAGAGEGAPRFDDHRQAFGHALEALAQVAAPEEVGVVGHRVVHGGERYTRAVAIDGEALNEIEKLASLAPLHNPANAAGIRAARDLLPDARHVAVFDTAFHATLPRRAYLYGLPLGLYRDAGIRRYGFHGTSHQGVSARVAALLRRPLAELRIVTLHLGNGASAAAVDRGRSIDTTMGFTPLAGLLMGTRAGDVDPGVLLHLLRSGSDVEALDHLLQRRSGLLGLSGVSNDMRDVRAAADAGEDAARAALEVFAYRIRKTIGAYAAAMGGLDAIAFTGGIGENDARVRAEALVGLGFLGVELDEAANARHGPRIGREGAPVAVLVVPTDEDGVIARAALQVAAEREEAA